MTTIYFAGTEDSDFLMFGGGAVTTSTSNFRSAFSRSALQPKVASSTVRVGLMVPSNFSLSTFWLGAQLFPANLNNSVPLLSFVDSSFVVRLQFISDSTVSTNMKLMAGVAAGTFTQLGSTFPSGLATSTMAKVDVHMNYASVGGFVELYINGNLVFSFSGDPTTEGVTALANFLLQQSAATGPSAWSEVILADIDTRGLSLQTFPPVANGNTHNFDTGTPAAANVNETTINDATLDGSTTAGQIDEYTNGAVAAGTFDVIAFGISARAQKGATGPSKMDFVVRTAATDFFSSDVALSTFWQNYQNWWLTNPNTGVAWLTSQIGSTAGFNIGLKSVT